MKDSKLPSWLGFNNITSGVLCLIAGVLVVTILGSFRLLEAGRDAQEWVAHTQLVLMRLNGLQLSITDAETAQRGFLLSRNKKFLAPLDLAKLQIPQQINQIQTLTADNPVQQARIPALQKQIADKLSFVEETIKVTREQGFQAARTMVETGKGDELMQALRSQIRSMIIEERTLLIKRLARAQEANEMLVMMFTLASICAVIVFAVVILAINRYIHEKQRLQAVLETLSMTDEMTKIYNRRGFLMMAYPLLKVASREKKQCALVFVDMDGLKRINDTIGHEEGSKAICAVARSLTEVFRRSDVIARWGGDEFVVLAYGADDEFCTQIIERIEAKFAELSKALEMRYPLAASFGIEKLAPGGVTTTADLEAALATADERMYIQKQERKSVKAESGIAEW